MANNNNQVALFMSEDENNELRELLQAVHNKQRSDMPHALWKIKEKLEDLQQAGITTAGVRFQ